MPEFKWKVIKTRRDLYDLGTKRRKQPFSTLSDGLCLQGPELKLRESDIDHLQRTFLLNQERSGSKAFTRQDSSDEVPVLTAVSFDSSSDVSVVSHIPRIITLLHMSPLCYLTSITFQHVPLGDTLRYDEFIPSMFAIENLEVLIFDDCADESFKGLALAKSLAKSLVVLHRLKVLAVKNCNIGDLGAESMALAFVCPTKVRSLFLDGNGITATGWEKIFRFVTLSGFL